MAARKRRTSKAATRTGRWKTLFLAQLASTGNVTVSAATAGVDRRTAYEHRKSDPAFAEEWDDALEGAADLLEAEARRRAVAGMERKKFTRGGQPVIDPATGEQYVEREYSDRLLMFLMRAAQPTKYGNKAGEDNAAAFDPGPTVLMPYPPPTVIAGEYNRDEKVSRSSEPQVEGPETL